MRTAADSVGYRLSLLCADGISSRCCLVMGVVTACWDNSAQEAQHAACCSFPCWCFVLPMLVCLI